MDPVLAIAGLGAIASWLQILIAEKRNLKAKEKRAVEALFNAAKATQNYSKKTKPPTGSGKGKRDPSTEYDISQLWYEASDYLYRINPNLADRCDTKGAYWSSPNNKRWKSAHSELASIKLKDILKEARALRKSI